MSGAFVVVAMVAAVNAARVRLALPDEAATGRPAPGPLALGAGVALVVMALGLAVAGPLLDGLDIAPESFEIAAGLILALVGARDLVLAMPKPEPVLPGWAGGLVPVAFPLVLNPGVVALVIALGALGSSGEVLVGAVVALAVVVVSGMLRPIVPVLAGLARLHGVALVGVGVQLIVEGVRDV